MQITKKIGKKTLANKLNAMFDYVIDLELNTQDNYIIIGDRHGTDKMEVQNVKPNTYTPLKFIKHRVDRRELSKKLKAMTEYYIYITFDTEHSLIILDGIQTKEQSTYFCSCNPARTHQQTIEPINPCLDFFKKLLGIEE